MGTPLGPDPRFSDDLQAIDDYVRTQARGKVGQYPGSLKAIEDYEKWRQDLGWVDTIVNPNQTINTAKAKRAAINQAQQQVLPADYEVESGSFQTPPEDSTKKVMSSATKFALMIGAGIVGTFFLVAGVKRLSPVNIARKALSSKPKSLGTDE
jgi:hypothetical protein